MTHINSPFRADDPEWDIPSNEGPVGHQLLQYAKRVVIPKLEKLYGKTCPGCWLESIEFHNGAPQIFIPKPFTGGFQIWLTTASKTDLKCAVFELAHECVHALKPVKRGEANVLEEGLAVKNSMRPKKQEFREWVFDREQWKKYRVAEMYARAYEAVESLEKLLDLERFIRKIRSDPCKGISDITSADLYRALDKKYHDQLDEVLRRAPLTSSFEKWVNSHPFN